MASTGKGTREYIISPPSVSNVRPAYLVWLGVLPNPTEGNCTKCLAGSRMLPSVKEVLLTSIGNAL